MDYASIHQRIRDWLSILASVGKLFLRHRIGNMILWWWWCCCCCCCCCCLFVLFYVGLANHDREYFSVLFTLIHTRSPDLNPIEMMFHSYKAVLKRYSGKNVPSDVAQAYGLQNVTPDVARSSFKHCGIPRCEHYPTKDEIETRKRCADLIEAVGVATIAKVAQVCKRRRL